MLSVGNRRRIHEHELALADQDARQRPDLYFPYQQTAGFMRATHRIGALLRKSVVWSMRHRRAMLAPEALEVQGVGPIYTSEHYDQAYDGQ